MKRILILALVLLITGGGAVAAYGEDGSQLWLRLDAVGATSAITGVKGVAMTELQTYWQGGPVTLKRQKGMARDGYTIKSQGEKTVISASSTAVLWPLRFVSTASRLVTRLLPTPPLPLTTAITFFTLLNAFCASSRLSGLLRDAQSAPQLEQSCVHSDMTFHLSLRSS